ncbi:MAG: flagellar M-ring protein FliF [Gammaproteobacteria bacterium]|nr:flagellar M-ring protein FliF [Gammaproteobacteria bacterium]
METVEVISGAPARSSLRQVPGLRPLVLMLGIAASVAAGVAAVVWSLGPNYSLLYGGLTEQDAAEVVQALQSANIKYRVEAGSGAIMVPAAKLHDARLQVAAQGLPRSAGVGFEFIRQDQGFGVSQFIETARYQHALETELSRTISSLQPVQSARVHLAVPKQTVFVRHRRQPSASVVLHLFPGRRLEPSQVAAIVNMVSSSVPELSHEQVTVVDEQGRLLSRPGNDSELASTSWQFDYARRLEETLVGKISGLLTPILGEGRVRAQVAADVDFTMTEQTMESFDPANSVIRSEQLQEQQQTGVTGAQGVPGALSNQPPEAGAEQPDQQAEEDNAQTPVNNSQQITRNYEIDKTISHTRQPVGVIKRVTVAVLVDDMRSVDAEGNTVQTPLTEEQLAWITTLVKDAVGFDEQRGDSVNVVNASFQTPPLPEPLEEPPIWQQPQIQLLIKQGVGVLFGVLVLFGIIRPLMRNLTQPVDAALPAPQQAAAGALPALADDRATLSGPGGQHADPRALGYDDRVQMARNITADDPRRVAQVVKNWVADDG